jgi:hypothetical protein
MPRRPSSQSRQLELFAKRKRPRGAARGRLVRPDRVGFVSHLTRPAHDARHPIHITMRRVRLGPSFREELVYRAILAELADAKRRGTRVLHTRRSTITFTLCSRAAIARTSARSFAR